MNEENFSLSDESVIKVIDLACEMGWLKPVEHGYCFYCNTEKAVYDIIMRDAPTQPPRCESCFIEAAQIMASDPETVKQIQKNFSDLSDEP